jgi:uncharacterized protein (DUF1778 family)
MMIPDDALAEIDESSGGNRTAFMVSAALERARLVRRQREDLEIAQACMENAASDAELMRDWQCTLGDGIG